MSNYDRLTKNTIGRFASKNMSLKEGASTLKTAIKITAKWQKVSPFYSPESSKKGS